MGIQHATKVFDAAGFSSAAQRLVLLELAYRADRKGVVRYSQSEIAEASTLARRTVATWFDRFEAIGLLQRLGHGRYQLDLEMLDLPNIFEPTPQLKTDSQSELERLQAIRKPGQYIAWSTNPIWPHLIDDPDGSGLP
jgi:hypothetical protein